jgi:Fe-S-cluster containining protein
MNDTTNICLSCGACCDGTLIGFVELYKDELPAIRELMDIEDQNGKGFFLQPCNKYCDGCTIYSKRPKKCAEFKCGLLTSVEKGELAFDTAVEIVTVVKQKKSAIEQKIAQLKLVLKSPSFYFKMVEVKNLLKKIKSESSLTERHLALASDIEQLDSLLAERFDVTLD